MTITSTPAPKPTAARAATPTRKIKVLHLITSLEVGGAQHGLLLGLPRFDPDRYEHVICSLMDRMQMAIQFRQAGIEVHSLGLRRKTDLAVALRLRTLLRQLRPDILHTYLLHSNVVGRIVGRLVGVPAIIGSERTIGQARRWGRLATRLTNSLTDAVEVNSETGAQAVERDLGVPPEKIEVVRSGIDLDAFGWSAKRAETRSALGVADSHQLTLGAPVPGRASKVCVARHPLTQPPHGIQRAFHGLIVSFFRCFSYVKRHPEANLGLAFVSGLIPGVPVFLNGRFKFCQGEYPRRIDQYRVTHAAADRKAFHRRDAHGDGRMGILVGMGGDAHVFTRIMLARE